MIVLERGRVVDAGPTTSLFAAPRHEHTRRLIEAAPRVDRGEPLQAVSAPTVLSIGNAVIDYTDLRAVDDVSFAVQSGETVAIVGESGSGKSSLVRGMLGLIPFAAGRVIYAGDTLAGRVRQRAQLQRRDLQLVFQDPVSALDPQMRVQAIVEEPLAVHERGMSRADREERVVATLEKVGLDERYLRRYPHELSGGQAQRISIARALVLGPKVLVCDEAVAALDGTVRKQVLEVLAREQRETGLSIVFISHDLAVVRTISHRVLVMYMGHLVESAESAALFKSPRHPYTKALLASIPVPDPVAPPRRAALKGEVSSLLDPPSGCVFHPRCPRAEATCSDKRPALRRIGDSRVACHFAE
jgi:oligopeptide/dipeptide ABC transporter ATP-binding protein